MGSIISLGIEKLELDWGKNSLFSNHSNLFQEKDIKIETYFYADNHKQKKKAYSAPLSKVRKRLNLLGYTIRGIKKKYVALSKDYYDTGSLSFKQFSEIIQSTNIRQIKFSEEDEYSQDHDFGEYFKCCVAPKLGITALSPAGDFFENLDPYIALRIFAEDKDNLNRNVIWRYQDVIEGGYISEDKLYQPLNENQKFLIITEGSSDLFVIKKSLEMFHPDVFDFFSFIDMQDNYPFTGTGNLYRFLQGLSKIPPANKVLVLFDNDTEGNEKYDLCKKLKLPCNIEVIKLPVMNEFCKYKTIGPTGIKLMNINGKAVSIECFLDLRQNMSKKPVIRWTSYNRELNKYQGCLEYKDSYVRQFKNIEVDNSRYNFAKLKQLTEYIISHCALLTEKASA